MFTQRHKAEVLGLEDAVDLRLVELRRKRDDLQTQLNAAHDKGTRWIDKVIRAFELVKLLEEAILCGSRQTRDLRLSAIASNFSVERKNLILTLRTPFRECAQSGGRLQWWSMLYDVRTEIFETCERLETAFSLLQEAKCN